MTPTDPAHLPRLSPLPFLDPRLVSAPGMVPMDPSDWLARDAVFAPQMALRDALIAGRRAEVLAEPPASEALAQELLAAVLAALDPGYRRDGGRVIRPDGGVVDPAADTGFATVGRLVQADLLVLEKPPGAEEYRLAGGVLCFPSRWSLAEKMAKGMLDIHAPVPFYAEALGRRVARLFDALHPDRPLRRANWLVHLEPQLFQPKPHTKTPRDYTRPGPLWLRVERQGLRRLASGAVVFSIKTDVAPLDSLTAAEGAGLIAAVSALGAAEYAYKGGDPLLARLRALFPAPVDSPGVPG